jgi:hypothetical protein
MEGGRVAHRWARVIVLMYWYYKGYDEMQRLEKTKLTIKVDAVILCLPCVSGFLERILAQSRIHVC